MGDTATGGQTRAGAMRGTRRARGKNGTGKKRRRCKKSALAKSSSSAPCRPPPRRPGQGGRPAGNETAAHTQKAVQAARNGQAADRRQLNARATPPPKLPPPARETRGEKKKKQSPRKCRRRAGPTRRATPARFWACSRCRPAAAIFRRQEAQLRPCSSNTRPTRLHPPSIKPSGRPFWPSREIKSFLRARRIFPAGFFVRQP